MCKRSTRRREDDGLTHEEIGHDAADVPKLLEVVEDQQHPRRAKGVGHVVVGPQPERLGDQRPDASGLAQRRKRHEEDATREGVGELGRGLERQPRLAGAAWPGEGDQPRPVRDQLAQRRELVVASQQRPRGDRQVAAMQRLQRRELAREAVDDQLVQLDRLEHVLEPVRTEVDELDAVEQRPRRPGDKDLPAMPGGHDPRRAMDVHADVVRRDGERLAGVDPDPDPDLDAGRPARPRERQLSVGRRGDRVLRSGECHEQGVALLVHRIAGVSLECPKQQPPMELQHAGVGVRTKPLQELRRALDVGEQERDGPGRLRDHRATMEDRSRLLQTRR